MGAYDTRGGYHKNIESAFLSDRMYNNEIMMIRLKQEVAKLWAAKEELEKEISALKDQKNLQ